MKLETIGISSVAGDPRDKLRDQARMIERFFFGGAQVGFGTGHPKEVALEDHLLVAKRTTVVGDQSFFREREQAIKPAIDEAVGDPRFLV